MSILLLPIAIAAIVFFCWLLFTLAIFVLPFQTGVAAGLWAWHHGVGWFGALLVGLISAGATLATGQFLIIVLPWFWVRIAVALLFVAPAFIAGFYATHGIVVHVVSTEPWQLVLSIIGAFIVGCFAWLRIIGTAMAAAGRP